ncbi:MAG: hypothetical protein V3V20_00600 [Algisphaera sp.]
MVRSRKQPKFKTPVKATKKPRIADRFAEEDAKDGKIHFRFRYFDGGFRPAKTEGQDCFYDISSKLKSFEQNGWNDLIQNKKSHHPIELHKLAKPAQKRLEELSFDDLDSLFSLRLSGTQRLFGIRSNHLFYALWWDPNHQVCPSKKKHT